MKFCPFDFWGSRSIFGHRSQGEIHSADYIESGNVSALQNFFAGVRMKPLALDLCCGLGGWAKGLIAAGWDVWGVDIDGRFEDLYPGTFWREDVCMLTGQAVRDAMWISCSRQILGLVLASPPCLDFSRWDQPWTRKHNPPQPDTSIWKACERIAAECGAPLILENVRGAQKFMGTAKWHCGPFYLWGDVPALMPKICYRHKESRSGAAAAERAEIPFELALHIGRVFHPGEECCA